VIETLLQEALVSLPRADQPPLPAPGRPDAPPWSSPCAPATGPRKQKGAPAALLLCWTLNWSSGRCSALSCWSNGRWRRVTPPDWRSAAVSCCMACASVPVKSCRPSSLTREAGCRPSSTPMQLNLHVDWERCGQQSRRWDAGFATTFSRAEKTPDWTLCDPLDYSLRSIFQRLLLECWSSCVEACTAKAAHHRHTLLLVLCMSCFMALAIREFWDDP